MARVDKAKELINDITVGQVAEQVGYYDSKALIRVFRRYQRTTPAKMRNVIQ